MSGGQQATWRMDEALTAAIRAHRSAGRQRRFAAGAALYEQGEISPLFYFVEAGMVQVSILRADGTETILEYMGPDTICGEGAAFDRLPRFSSAVAVEETVATAFDADRLGDLFAADPGFAAALLRATSLKQRVLAVRLEQLVSREPEGRLMELFRRLAVMFGTDHPGGRLLVNRLTHEEIAAMTGTSRVTVTRCLQRLREAGAIDLVGGRFLVRDRPTG
ncbi:Crp/Fnr family transcriptional regulator [Marinibaculum pumilum]|uniref:Crp/Fnr family transcriptional regulator n=1 Tax=Marinibaculum pumilum TaxID=1766165 RepID=A0ABV7L9C6_9PROT